MHNNTSLLKRPCQQRRRAHSTFFHKYKAVSLYTLQYYQTISKRKKGEERRQRQWRVTATVRTAVAVVAGDGASTGSEGSGGSARTMRPAWWRLRRDAWWATRTAGGRQVVGVVCLPARCGSSRNHGRGARARTGTRRPCAYTCAVDCITWLQMCACSHGKWGGQIGKRADRRQEAGAGVHASISSGWRGRVLFEGTGAASHGKRGANGKRADRAACARQGQRRPAGCVLFKGCVAYVVGVRVRVVHHVVHVR